MPSIRSVMREELGVVLVEVALTSPGGATLATAWTVESRRTSEVRTSHSLSTAEQHFAEEVSRCRGPARVGRGPR